MKKKTDEPLLPADVMCRLREVREAQPVKHTASCPWKWWCGKTKTHHVERQEGGKPGPVRRDTIKYPTHSISGWRRDRIRRRSAGDGVSMYRQQLFRGSVFIASASAGYSSKIVIPLWATLRAANRNRDVCAFQQLGFFFFFFYIQTELRCDTTLGWKMQSSS